jgi:hypothetical protein
MLLEAVAVTAEKFAAGSGHRTCPGRRRTSSWRTNLWRTGRRELAIGHFAESHQLQPENWTYKRQAWSLVGNERVGGSSAGFVQGPPVGAEDKWPFPSDRSDVSQLGAGEYYPRPL